MVTTEERLEILRDITPANQLVQAVEGGAEALPKLARGDLGALWVIDLARQLGLSASWASSQLSVTVPAAGGRASGSFEIAARGAIIVGLQIRFDSSAAAIADLEEASCLYFPGAGSPPYRIVSLWDTAVGSGAIGFADGGTHWELLRPNVENLPFVQNDLGGTTHQPLMQISGKSAAGAAAAFDLEFWFWILTFDAAQVGVDPLLTTEVLG